MKTTTIASLAGLGDTFLKAQLTRRILVDIADRFFIHGILSPVGRLRHVLLER